MKRAMKPCLFLVWALALAGSAAVGRQSSAAQTVTTEQASRADQKSLAPPSQKDGTGVVPSGVKLVPEIPSPGAPRPFDFPPAATKTLANGLRVFVVADHDEPAIAARLVILTAGSVKDPAGMPGVAQMTAGLLTQGTKKRSAQEIAEAIDFIGGSLEASSLVVLKGGCQFRCQSRLAPGHPITNTCHAPPIPIPAIRTVRGLPL